jgi:hypothetical protein
MSIYRDPIFGPGMPLNEPVSTWIALGLKFGDKGTHTSRTIMVEELTGLLAACPMDAKRDEYARAATEENCMGKHTVATRRLTLQRLSELYGFDEGLPLFRLLRVFWAADDTARPRLALLTALARDPLLRATAPVIMEMAPGEEIARQRMTDALRAAVQGRLNDDSLDKVVRNAASSWTQSGHLEGRSRKKRLRLTSSPASTAYAILLGYLMGVRGSALFETLFAHVLDRDANELTFLAMDARRLGLLDIKSGGGMLVVSFDSLLTEDERRLSHGPH